MRSCKILAPVGAASGRFPYRCDTLKQMRALCVSVFQCLYFCVLVSGDVSLGDPGCTRCDGLGTVATFEAVFRGWEHIVGLTTGHATHAPGATALHLAGAVRRLLESPHNTLRVSRTNVPVRDRCHRRAACLLA